jgi:integrase
MKTVFDWAIAAGHRTAGNPCAAITKVLPRQNGEKQHFAALQYDEVPAFIRELRNDAGVSGRLAFEFLILCAARTGEVIQATWKEVDFAKTQPEEGDGLYRCPAEWTWQDFGQRVLPASQAERACVDAAEMD